jgi:hypothetical protein
MEIVKWVQMNWTDVTTVIAYVIAIASIVVKFTPTLKDDDALKGVIKFVGKYIALNR